MSKLIIRITRMHIVPENEPLFSELVYTVEIDDQAGGEYIVLKDGSIRTDKLGVEIDPDHWPMIRECIEQLIHSIKLHEKEADQTCDRCKGAGDVVDIRAGCDVGWRPCPDCKEGK